MSQEDPGAPPPGGATPGSGPGWQQSNQPGPGQDWQQPNQPGPGPAWQQPNQTGSRPVDQGAGTDDRTLAVLAHLSPIIALVLSAGLLSWLGPLLIYLLFRDRSHLVRNASATAFNFHITVWLAIIAGWICAITIVLLPLAIILWIAAVVCQLVFSILGAVRANRREIYTYPFQVPILK